MGQVASVINGLVRRVIQYATENPIRTATTVVNSALSIVMGPVWPIRILLNTLGFGIGGVTAGTIAAWWQGAAYGGAVPAGSVFAWAQHLGAVVGRAGLGA